MSEKALRQQTPANRPEIDLQATSVPPDLSPLSNVPAVSVSVPNTHAFSSSSNIEALTFLNESLACDYSPSTGTQGLPEPNQAAGNNDAAYHLRYLFASIVGPAPPAYRPNNE